MRHLIPPDKFRSQRTDRVLINLAAGLRASAVSLSGVMLALHLASLQLDLRFIGVVISIGLAGCAFGTFVVTVLTERLGRRTTLAILTCCMGAGGIFFALVRHPTVLVIGAFMGMVNGMGRDRGAGLTIDQTMLPQTAAASARTSVFAWYNLTVDAGHAVGSLLGGLPAFLRAAAQLAPLASYQWSWGLYSVLCILALCLTARLSQAVERPRGAGIPARLSRASRPIVAKFAALSALDSFGGGFLTTALLGYWFFKRFSVDEALLGPLFFAVRIANGLSHLGAAWIAKRIGLVKTMVFTHLPSSLLLMTVPFAPNLPVAVFLFLIRESLVEMDVPTRQSYLVAVVREEERIRAAGITNLTRGVAWAIAPMMAGSAMQSLSLSAPLVIGSGLKILYDLGLYRAFRHLKPPEERPKHFSAPP